MYTSKILAVYTLCALLFTVYSLPADRFIIKREKFSKLVPINYLQRARRDLFYATANDKDKESNSDAETKHTTILKKLNNGEEGVVKGDKKEVLKAAADTIYPVVYRVRRAGRNNRKYEDTDNDYDNSDYAGYDRKGSEVGYMDSSDDFPTVVW